MKQKLLYIFIVLFVLSLCGCLSANRPASGNTPGAAQTAAAEATQTDGAATERTTASADPDAQTAAQGSITAAQGTLTAAQDAKTDEDSDASARTTATAAQGTQSAAQDVKTDDADPGDTPAADHENEPEAADEPSLNTFAFPYVFSAEDLYGAEVTEASLGNRELFFVHYWATWCGPCVREMPELASIADDYDGRVGFIALLDDYNTSRETAVLIAEKSGVGFIMVDARHSDFRQLVRMAQSGYVPTTILIGKDGGVVGEQIIGALGEGYRKLIDAALGS